MKNSKRGLYVVVLIILIIAAFFVFQSLTKNSLDYGNKNKEITGGEVKEPTEDTESGKSAMSYSEALAKYKNQRIALDTACGAVPKNISVANNSKIMIDNLSPIDRIIKVGSIFNLKANSFKIVDVAISATPSTLSLDCDKSLGVATVSVVQ